MDTKAFIVTVDTEPDNEWNRPGPEHLTCENAKSLPQFQTLCETYGIKPVYLIDYVMAGDGFATEFLGDCAARDRCEIGAHMHPWSNPPFDVKVVDDDYKYHPFITEYPIEVFEKKLDCLKERIETRIGLSTTTFRAGRWVIDSQRAQILKQKGFTVDCSITPYRHWEKERKAAGSDHSGYGPKPFFWDEEHEILEVPLSGARFSPRRRGLNPHEWPLLKRNRFFLRVLDKILEDKMLDIRGGDWLFRYKKFKSIAVGLERYIQESNENFLQSMLHSSELHLGSCFTHDSELRAFWRVLEESFSRVRAAKFSSMTMSEFRINRSTQYVYKKAGED